MAPQSLTIAGLDTLHIPTPTPSASTPSVVMLHGYGADQHDLAPLQQIIQIPGGANWYFPNGPQSLHFGGSWTGRAWFPIDMLRLQTLLEHGRFDDIPALLTPGLFAARECLLGFLKKLNVAPSQLILAGFSQGALLALETALSLPLPTKALALFSAIHLTNAQWDERFPRLSQTPVFQSHGEQDAVLPFVFAERLHQALEAAAVPTSFYRFTGGHEIPALAIRSLNSMLTQVMAQ